MQTVIHTEHNDNSSFNDYEESIMFDEDDPDFVPNDETEYSCQSMYRCLQKENPISSDNNNMSLTGVQSMSNQNLRNINDKMLDNIDLVSDIEQAVTLEELQGVFKYCFRCGVNWEQHHVSLDCLECGGYSLERPCPICAGHCRNVWKRDLEESHRSGEASWIGECSSKCKEMGRGDVNQMCNRLEKVKATF
ncbi:protein pinocchio [Adelges cooleyi]|uniref:protein pinocchio n=1 Tax=Adelges cooleyi TaxID=133065 RepID=UPI00218048BA|nr:protein pinocchio [Adelges cooleyi]